MPRLIALLRGINVGGKTMIKMETLRELFESLGFGNVRSYINSGNIGFDADSDEGLEARLEAVIAAQFAFAPSVMIRSREEILALVAANPFAGEFESEKEMHLVFLKSPLSAENEALLVSMSRADERFAVSGPNVYCLLRAGVAGSLLGKKFIDTRLRTPATARNWRTVRAVSEL